jgi:hypothetical protein
VKVPHRVEHYHPPDGRAAGRRNERAEEEESEHWRDLKQETRREACRPTAHSHGVFSPVGACPIGGSGASSQPAVSTGNRGHCIPGKHFLHVTVP